MKIQARISTAYDPETDSQTEVLNAVIEQCLRYYVSYQQKDWADWLPIAEFAANKQVLAATNATTFLTNYGYHFQLNYEHLRPATTPQTKEAEKFTNTMLDLQQYLLMQLRVTQDKYETSTNKPQTRAPAYQVGDKVLLSGKNIRITRIV